MQTLSISPTATDTVVSFRADQLRGFLINERDLYGKDQDPAANCYKDQVNDMLRANEAGFVIRESKVSRQGETDGDRRWETGRDRAGGPETSPTVYPQTHFSLPSIHPPNHSLIHPPMHSHSSTSSRRCSAACTTRRSSLCPSPCGTTTNCCW
jgi:hypothetical protein